MIPTLALLAGSLLAVPQERPADASLQPLSHAELSGELRALAQAHPERCALETLGLSRAGRPIEVLRIGAPDGERARPAILLVAGLEGPFAYTSSLALHHARELCGGELDGARAELLATTTIYVVPRANLDACEARFETPRRERRGSGHGVDRDRDGRGGEDDVADLDGDGIVAWMRILDEEGTFIPDPADARVLVPAERAKGERGRWKLLPEGRDDDGDGEVGEDPPLDAEVNRNFPHAFEEHTPRAGLFATDEPETQALCDFVLAHPEIALVVAYGELMNLVKDPKTAPEGGRGRGRLPPREVLAEDGPWLAELGRRYREASGNQAKGSEDDAGTFQGWAYHHRGLVTLAITPFEIPLEEPKGTPERRGPRSRSAQESAEAGPAEDAAETPATPAAKPGPDARRLAWLESQGVEGAFLDWTPFEHPELGPVELGGWAPYARLEPPPAQHAPLAQAHFDFFVSLGALLPRPRLVEVRARELAPGLVELTGTLRNDALLPLETAAARRARTVRPVRISPELPSGARILAGPPFELVRGLGGVGARRELRWLVQSPPEGLGLALDSDFARGTVQAEVTR